MKEKSKNYCKNINISDSTITMSYLQTIIYDFISATNEWHSIEDCEVEGRKNCQLCQTIKHYKVLLDA